MVHSSSILEHDIFSWGGFSNKNADRMPDRGQVLFISQENLKLAAFHYRWQCTFDWEEMGVWEDTVCPHASQRRLEDDYKAPEVLPKVNKVNMAGTLEAIKENLRSCHCIMKTPLVFIIRKTMVVQTYGDYPWYVTFDNEMIASMLHFLTRKE